MAGSTLARRWRIGALALVLGASVSACDTARPIRPTNHPPVGVTLSVFPEIIAPGDSAIVICAGADPDGDPLMYFWFSDCRLVKKGASSFDYYHTPQGRLVVYPGSCIDAPIDTGWVSCEVSDGHFDGWVYPAPVRVIIRQ